MDENLKLISHRNIEKLITFVRKLVATPNIYLIPEQVRPKFAQYESEKIKGRRKMPSMNEQMANLQ